MHLFQLPRVCLARVQAAKPAHLLCILFCRAEWLVQRRGNLHEALAAETPAAHSTHCHCDRLVRNRALPLPQHACARATGAKCFLSMRSLLVASEKLDIVAVDRICAPTPIDSAPTFRLRPSTSLTNLPRPLPSPAAAEQGARPGAPQRKREASKRSASKRATARHRLRPAPAELPHPRVDHATATI